MSVVQVVSAIGAIPLFSIRTFFPAFLMALLLAFPNLFPGMADDAQAVETGSFFAKNWLLILLGILSILEFIGDKVPEIKSVIKEAEPYLKPASYLAVEMGLVTEGGSEVLNQVQWAGFDPMILLYIFGVLAVYTLASLRKQFLDFLEDIDEDDNMYIGQIISWLEDSLVLFGFLLLIWAGITMVIIYGIIIALFVYWRRKNEKKLEQQKIGCSNCGNKNAPFAIRCSECGQDQTIIFEIGTLGQKKNELVSDLVKHQFNLTSHRRCANCAEKLPSRSPNQVCSACNHQLFDQAALAEFKKRLNRKFYKLLVFSFLIGFIPIIGFMVSAVYANIYLFAPYRKYISRRGSFATKIFIRILTFFFFVLGIALGFIAAPVYCAMRYYIWKSKFEDNFQP